MFSNEQVTEYMNTLIKETENHLNEIELECKRDTPNVGTISVGVGKVMKVYQLLAYLMGVYDNDPKNSGGFRESFRNISKTDKE
mgnify:CR=1 FL=1